MRSVCLILFCSLAACAIADGLDERISRMMTESRIPGVSIAIVKNGKISRLSNYGFANLEWKTKTTSDTRYEIASMTKMLTGAGAKLLLERGKLRLSDPIGMYFPDAPKTWSPMVVDNLVRMTLGLDDDWGTDALPYGAEVIGPSDDSEMLRAFYKQKLESPIGDQHRYSSPAYTMLGMIVAKIAGQSLAEFLSQNVFGPAKMANTGFIDNSAIVPNRAEGYRIENGQLKRGWLLGQYQHSRPCVGVSTTSRDLANWLIALTSQRIVHNLDSLWAPAISSTGNHIDYAYGWYHSLLFGHKMFDHDGRFRTGFQSSIAWFPAENIGIVVLCNLDSANASRIAYQVARTVIKDLPDLEQNAAKLDTDPSTTAKLVAALRDVAQGRVDAAIFEPDAFQPLSIVEVAALLKAVERFESVGRRKLTEPIAFHSYGLTRYQTLRLAMKSDSLYLTFYFNEAGKVAYIGGMD